MVQRRGFTILELAVAMVILGAAMVLCVRWVAANASQQQQLRWRQAALDEAANVMERIAAQPWERVSPEHVARLAISDEARRLLPDGKLAVQVNPAPGDPSARQIAVTVQWRPRTDEPVAEVRLVAWRFPRTK